jgi:hypothetical protein
MGRAIAKPIIDVARVEGWSDSETLNLRMDRFENRLARIERRLEMTLPALEIN